MSTKKKIKICGMRDDENIRQVASYAPDFMGFIFYPESPRFVGNKFQIPRDLPNEIARVGVFVNKTTNEILRFADKHGLEFIQLHGGESVDQCTELKRHGLKIIKVFSIGTSFDFSVVKEFIPVTDYFLFDTKSSMYGGSGKIFDWSLLTNYKYETPFFLSGGLTPVNYHEVLQLNNDKLNGLDFNSGLELNPGMKDIELVKQVLVN